MAADTDYTWDLTKVSNEIHIDKKKPDDVCFEIIKSYEINLLDAEGVKYFSDLDKIKKKFLATSTENI